MNINFLKHVKAVIDFILSSEHNTVKLRFYVFREFMHFLYGPGQMPITVTLNFNGFYVSAVSRFP
jgi:hypothetical protein